MTNRRSWLPSLLVLAAFFLASPRSSPRGVVAFQPYGDIEVRAVEEEEEEEELLELSSDSWNLLESSAEKDQQILHFLKGVWKMKEWNRSAPVCTNWTGITCDRNSRVIKLEVKGKRLAVDMPVAVCELSELRELYLFDTKLTGHIPHEIGQLAQLTHFSVGLNRMDGFIPETIADLKELRFLYLNDNKFEGRLPDGLRNLQHLQHLGIWNNKLSGNLPEVDPQNWSEMEYLWFNGNNFTGSIPVSLARLPKLKVAYFSNNWALEGDLPREFAKLESLQLLFVQKTNITGTLPCDFVDHKHVMRVDATITKMEGCQDLDCLKQKCAEASRDNSEL